MRFPIQLSWRREGETVVKLRDIEAVYISGLLKKETATDQHREPAISLDPLPKRILTKLRQAAPEGLIR